MTPHPIDGRKSAARSVAAAVAAALALSACDGGSAAGGGEAASPGDRPAAAASETGAGSSSGPAADRRAFPEGWQVRTDRGDTTPGAVNFTATAGGYRVRPGPRAIYWDPEMRAAGTFRATATFRQLNQPRAPEAYGLFVGGRDLQSPGQDYLYFLIRRGGQFLVKHRAGDETHTLTSWTGHDAVETGTTGQASPRNTLTVVSAGDAVRFLVNGTEVERLDRAPMLNTDGQVGVRVNHGLDVRFTDFRVEPLEAAGAGEGG